MSVGKKFHTRLSSVPCPYYTVPAISFRLGKSMEIPSNHFSAPYGITQGKIIYDLALCGALSVMRFWNICVPSYAKNEHKCGSLSVFCDKGHRIYPVAKFNSENIWKQPFTRRKISRLWGELEETKNCDMGWMQTNPRKSWSYIARGRLLLPFEVRWRNEMRNWTSTERIKRDRCRDSRANGWGFSKRLRKEDVGKQDGIDPVVRDGLNCKIHQRER